MHPAPTKAPSALFAIFRPWLVRIATFGTAGLAALSAYDAASNQLNLPKLPALASIIVTAIPLWGWFILSQYALLFAGFQYLRRQRSEPGAPAVVSDPRLDGILAKQAAIIDDYQRMMAIEARFNQQIDGVKTSLQRSDDGPMMHLKVLEQKLTTLSALPSKVEENRVSIAIHAKEIEKVDGKVEKVSTRAQTSFHALYSRERLIGFEKELADTAAVLYDRLAAGDTYSSAEWEKWRSKLSYWESNLSQWIDAARWYAPNVEKRVMAIDEKKYAGPWTVKDEQIPDAEGTRQFRKFRILHHQWDDVRHDVHRGLIQVAYVGLSEKDVQTSVSPNF